MIGPMKSLLLPTRTAAYCSVASQTRVKFRACPVKQIVVLDSTLVENQHGRHQACCSYQHPSQRNWMANGCFWLKCLRANRNTTAPGVVTFV